MTDKPRLRLTSKGWYRYWTKFANDFTGRNYNEIWIGPFATAEEAMHWALTR